MSNVVLVTGAAGFVGRHLLHTLAAANPSESIVAWRRPSSAPSNTDRDSLGTRWQEIDLLKDEVVRKTILELKPTRIYHCAGAASVHDSWDRTLSSLEGNILAANNLLRAVSLTGIQCRILITGSALVYRPSDQSIDENAPVGPVSPYGLSKLGQEMLAQQYVEDGLQILLPRSFTHIGPGQSASYAASSFAQQIARIEIKKAPPVIKVGALDAMRDLTDVRDTVQAYMMLMDHGKPGRPYNVCSGKAYPMRHVLNRLIDLAKVPVTVTVDESRLRPSDNPLLLGNPMRINNEMGWKPRIPLKQTLKDLLEHWRNVEDGNTREGLS
jgi:GDP-4-dehydro-6-deoxy-D-mannose reductase